MINQRSNTMYNFRIPGKNSLRLNLALLAMLLISSCDRSKEDKGREYFPDMAHQYNYKTFSENPAMEDGQTMQIPVEGTVPTHMQPYPYPATFEGRQLAGQNLQNPLTITPAVLDEGKELYDIFCAQCHGVAGDGKGWLHTSGKYVIPPTNLLEQRIIDQPEGESFHVISAGWGVMGPHASLITPDQRWKIVAFVEQILQDKK
jgi:mono/diheme cytochrome c family protein